MVSISLCMIVKNEEKVLDRCLSSLAPVMDEIIVVDTGSTDATKEIAAKYTDQIYDFVWTGSFCDARNFASQKATKEYIYTADADEYLDTLNQERLAQLKSILLPEIEMVQMLYCTQSEHNTVYNFEKEYRPKLYRRLREFTWIDPIHETLRTDPIVYDSQIEIMHCPQNNHAKRDLLALNEAGKRERLSKKLHHMYAMELYHSGTDEDFVEALPVFEQTLVQEARSMDEIKEAICILVRGYRLMGNVAKFFGYALKDAISTSCAEVCCELGCYYEMMDEKEDAILWYQNAAAETESILDIRTSQEIPRAGLQRLGIEGDKADG